MPGGHKAGFVALIGEPNVGKSTLLNALLKFPLSIVSPKPQTTRHRLVGILNGKGHQICLLDTPGWLERGEDRLQDALIRSARAAAKQDADLIVLLVEPRAPKPGVIARLSRLAASGKPLILAVNKTDLVKDGKALERVAELYARELPVSETAYVSALKGSGLKRLVAAVEALLPESPPYYEPGRLSDRWERFFAAEIVRGEIFNRFHEEVPHACAVVVDSFKETPGQRDRISVTIYVERPPQKGILLGKRGKALDGLRKASLKSIEGFLGRKADLRLWVKVRKNWRKDRRALKEFGYTL